MALSKSVPTDFGVDATYWNIGAVQEDFKGRGMEVTLYGYINKQSRDDGKQPLAAGKQVLAGDAYVADAGRTEIYDVLKGTPEWAGAEDA